MGFEREKRLAGDPKRRGLDDELDRRLQGELRALQPGKRTLVEQQLAAGYAEDVGSQLAVGRRTLLDRDRQSLAPAPHAASGEPVESAWSGPWAAFDDFRSRGLHEVLAAVSAMPGGRCLLDAAAERATRPALAGRPTPPDPDGLVLWRAAERRAAT